MPSLARTQRSSVTVPPWKVVLASWPALTLMAVLAVCALPPTLQWPLPADDVESQT